MFSAISGITLLSGQTPSILDNIFIHPGTFYTLTFLDSLADVGTCYSQGGLTQVVGKN